MSPRLVSRSGRGAPALRGLTQALAPVLALLLARCDEVPSLSFPGGALDGGAPLDAASPVGNDGDVEATAEVSPPDASFETGCPDQAPANASVCCGSVACNGNCTSAQCSVCEMRCGPGTLCCAKTNNVACRPTGGPCP